MHLLQRLKIIHYCFYIACILLYTSCAEVKRTSVKSYPTDKPFIFSNVVKIEGNITKDEKKRILKSLDAYWDDSLRTPKVQQLGFFYRIKNPPVLDTNSINRTEKLMTSYLQSQGYYGTAIKSNISIDSFKNQSRANVQLTINSGKNTLIDSVSYAITDTNLQRIATANSAKSFLVKNTPFSKEITAAELDRLVNIYRKNGYFKITKDNFFAEVDTIDAALLQLVIDPFEQANKIALAAARRAENPTINIEIKQRPISDSSLLKDSSSIKQYYIGDVHFYPEMGFNEIADSVIGLPTKKLYRRGNTYYHLNQEIFKIQALREHMYLKHNKLYNEDDYYKTINNLSQIGAWQQVDARPTYRNDTIDFHLFLTPALKNGYVFDIETSRNTGDFLGSNLIGIALNLTFKNRNVWRRAIQSNSYIRNGLEFAFNSKNNPTNTGSFIQTFQSSIGHSYSFPRFIAPFKIKRKQAVDGIRTIASINGSYTNRKDFYKLTSITTNWGYEWRVKNKVWKYQPLNIELYGLDTLALLREAFKTNAFLRTAFNTGSVVSQTLSLVYTYNNKQNKNISNYVRFGAEESGAIIGLINSARNSVYRYIKTEAEYKKLVILTKKTSFATRALAGIGYNYSKTAGKDSTLPFFKQFVAGGPNSMRAWGLRQLGLGSSLASDTSATFRDRFGDVQLELNFEYRFNVATIGPAKLSSALFTDIGNIWNLRANPQNPNSEINLKRLGKDIAIGIGTSARIDFDYFLIRLDFGIKLKDPARLENNGWLPIKDFTWRNYEFADGIRPNRNNYALQLGIGLPF